MFNYFMQLLPLTIPIGLYFIHLESTLAKMKTDICWIKKILAGQQKDPSGATK